jgi:hypothetical protein
LSIFFINNEPLVDRSTNVAELREEVDHLLIYSLTGKNEKKDNENCGRDYQTDFKTLKDYRGLFAHAASTKKKPTAYGFIAAMQCSRKRVQQFKKKR